MKTIMLTLATITIASPLFAGSAAAAGNARPSSDRSQAYRYGPDESWRSYPFYNGTYKGRPVSEWLRPGTW
jgi:hypothetical protein